MERSTGTVSVYSKTVYTCSDGEEFVDVQQAYDHERRILIYNALDKSPPFRGNATLIASAIIHNAAVINDILNKTISLQEQGEP